VSLPLCVSLPHAGLDRPPAIGARAVLTDADVARDGDEGAAVIYAALGAAAEARVATSIARAFIDMNRAEDDRRKDGVVKTHTCLDVPIYDGPLPEDVVEELLAGHHRPYHAALGAV
jgi:N-formylglutamate amidohydrolase